MYAFMCIVKRYPSYVMGRQPFVLVAVLLLMSQVLTTTLAITTICVVSGTTGDTPSNCDEEVSQMDTALDRVQRDKASDTAVRLTSGVHHFASFHLMESLFNLSITGKGPNKTILTCNTSIGFVFVNVTKLSISDLTITNCGLRNNYMEQAAQNISKYVQIGPIYTLLSPTSRALVLAQCSDVSLENVYIMNTVGVGLTGLNVLGRSNLTNVHFHNNTRDFRIPRNRAIDYVAGGAHFYFGATMAQPLEVRQVNTLQIVDCIFMKASSSAAVTQHILVDEFFEIDDFARLHNGEYSLDGSGGLSLIFMRTENGTQDVTVKNTQMISNNHPHGGCMLILFQNSASAVAVTLDDVVFDDCRGGGAGGGLLVGFGYPGSLNPIESTVFNYSHSVLIKNTRFQKCRGTWGGGTAILSIPLFAPKAIDNKRSSVTFTNCTWADNLGNTGSAVAFWEAKYHGVQKQHGLAIAITNCTFSRHRIEYELQSQTNAAVVNLDAVSVNFTGYTNFMDNEMSCIGATRSEVQVFGQLVAERSQVIFGGVLDFRDTSFLILKQGANIRFVRNEALWRGGAVSVNSFAPWPLTNVGTCFLHFNSFHACPNRPCYNLTNSSHGKIVFEDNRAALFGNEIFGETFEECPWLPPDIPGHELLSRLQEEFNDSIHFFANLSRSTDTVNSNLANVFFTDPNRPVPRSLMSGQQFNSRVKAVDFFNQSVPEIATLRVTSGRTGRVDTSGQFSLDGNVVGFIEGEENVRFEFTGDPGDNITFQFLPTSIFAPVGDFNFTFTECKPGFVNSTDNRCICDPILTQLHESITCLPDGTISHGPQRWIGSAIHSTAAKQIYSTSLCVFNYCDEDNEVVLDLGDDSEQCTNNRRGTLCGGCREGYSRVLGSSACRRCSNTTLTYILFFIGSGVLTVVFIVVFQISISNGYINGPVLYANIMATFSSVLFPQRYPPFESIPFVLISFLNLTIGYETCFYDGMTQLELEILRIAYPVYLLLIIIGFSLVIKLCPNRSFRFNLHPVSAIATVMFISFNTLLQACSEILGVAVLTFRGHQTGSRSEVRWLRDPTVVYGQGLHGFLVATALLLLFLVLAPVVLVLIFYKPLLKVNPIKKLLLKWWPFFDAFQNPYANHLRFWIGIQLLLRAASLFIAGSEQLTYYTNASLHQFSLFIMVLTLATFIGIEAFLKPFKGVLRNVLDLIFLLNLLYMLTSALYYNIIRLSIKIDESDLKHIQDVHYRTVQTALYFAVGLISLIFLLFILVRIGLLRAIDAKIIPNLPPKLRRVVLAILKDAGHVPSVSSGTKKGRRKPRKKTTESVVELDEFLTMAESHVEGGAMVMSTESYSLYRDSILNDCTRTLASQESQ